MFAAAESSIIFWLSIHILLLLWLRHHLIVMITFHLELNVSAHSKAAGHWRSGSLWVWFVSGWCCKLKSGRRLQMSSKRRLLFPCFGSVPLGTLAGTATGGYSYADTYQLHLLVFLDHVFYTSHQRFILNNSCFCSCWRPVDKSYWIPHKPEAVLGNHEWIPVRCEHIQNNLHGSWKFLRSLLPAQGCFYVTY